MKKWGKMIALLDASSAILLCKANLHLIVSEMYDIVMSESVYNEITNNSYRGAKEYQQLVDTHKITLQALPESSTKDLVFPELNKLGQGEQDLIRLYHAGYGNFIIIDDGPSAKYCKHKQFHFINALLIPVIMQYTKKHTPVACNTAFNTILNIGRYSDWVKSYAQKCQREDIAFFIP